MIKRNLTRRLEELEARLAPAAEPLIVQLKYVSPDGSEEDGPRYEIPVTRSRKLPWQWQIGDRSPRYELKTPAGAVRASQTEDTLPRAPEPAKANAGKLRQGSTGAWVAGGGEDSNGYRTRGG